MALTSSDFTNMTKWLLASARYFRSLAKIADYKTLNTFALDFYAVINEYSKVGESFVKIQITPPPKNLFNQIKWLSNNIKIITLFISGETDIFKKARELAKEVAVKHNIFSAE
jgi:hypothetical protein